MMNSGNVMVGEGIKFERIRRVTGYLVGTLDRFNNAKKAEERGIIAAVITDAGMTEFHGIPTKTCLALEPLPAEIADEITGELPLY